MSYLSRHWRQYHSPNESSLVPVISRPSRRFVPASERYPVALQKNRQESRQRRQAELLALQERTRLSRTEPPPQNHGARLCPNGQQIRTSPIKKVVLSSRGRSSPVPAIRPRVQNQQASNSPPPALEFIPYLRTAEVFNLDPLEPADTPPPGTHSGYNTPSGCEHFSVLMWRVMSSQSELSLKKVMLPFSSSGPPPPVSSHRDPLLQPEMLRSSQRQQEILRGLAQLRQ
ncbi:hypothetical protein GOODEAATRI_032506, partial [Goodea atripinnis]